MRPGNLLSLFLIPTWCKRAIRKLYFAFPSSHYALLSFFFFAGLELMFALPRWPLALFTILLTIMAIGIFFVRSEERGGFHISQAILPALAAFGLAAFAFFLPSTPWLHIYFAVAAFIFFLVLKYGAKQAYPTWNWMLTLVILLATMASMIGWRFHFYTPLIIILSISLAITTLLSLQSLQRFRSYRHEAWLIAFAFGFVLTQITWVMQFLPLHFIVQAGILVAVYYVMFQLTAISFERNLEKHDIIEYSVLGVSALSMLLLAARWS